MSDTAKIQVWDSSSSDEESEEDLQDSDAEFYSKYVRNTM